MLVHERISGEALRHHHGIAGAFATIRTTERMVHGVAPALDLHFADHRFAFNRFHAAFRSNFNQSLEIIHLPSDIIISAESRATFAQGSGPL